MCTGLKNVRYMQYLSAITATLSMTASGMYYYWISPSLTVLQSYESPVGRPISDTEGSVLLNLHRLAIIPAMVMGAYIVERIGRKSTLLASGVLLMLPWIVIIFANSMPLLYIARFAGGIASGLLLITCAIYNGEIADNDIRGRLGSTLIIMKLVGSLLMLSIGPYISYINLAFISAILLIIFLCAFVFMPESPYYLVKVNDIEEAEKSLKILSSDSASSQLIGYRLREIKQCVQEDMQSNTTLWEFLTKAQYRKAMLIMFGITTLQHLSGNIAIINYTETIINSSDINISQRNSILIFGYVQIPAVLVASLLVDRLGRKPLLIISALGCAVSLFAEGTFFYLQNVSQVDVSGFAWVPTAGLGLFQIMSPLGVVNLPYVLLGELFPMNIKGIAVSIVTLYGATITFIIAKLFEPAVKACGMYTVFWIFGTACILGAIFIASVLPETKRKSFSEIQRMLNYRRQNVEDYEMERRTSF